MQEEELIDLYKEMTPRITAKVARWLLRNKISTNVTQQAEDIVADAFVRVVRAVRRNVQFTYSNKSFIWYRVLKAMERFMEKQQSSGMFIHEGIDSFLRDIELNALEQIEADEAHEVAMEEIDADYLPIIQRLQEGYSYQEVRSETNKSPGAFRSWIYRLKNKIAPDSEAPNNL